MPAPSASVTRWARLAPPTDGPRRGDPSPLGLSIVEVHPTYAMRTPTLLLALAALIALPGCDAFGGGDPTIGGTYSGSGATNAGNVDSVTLTIPSGTESDPETSFRFTIRDADSGTFPGTGVYEFPSLRLSFDGAGTATCSVLDDGDTLDCAFAGGDLTLTR